MKIYENKNIKVLWDKERCIHAGRCTEGLPAVFNSERSPWIDVNAATAEAIMQVIDCCPSGALSYQVSGKEDRPREKNEETVTVRVSESGPYLVTGKCRLVCRDGEVLDTPDNFALCRCGHSCDMPFCDGSHRKVGYKEPPQKKGKRGT